MESGESDYRKADHDYTAHARYSHEVRAEWERFLDSRVGKKFRSEATLGRDAAQAFLRHVNSSGNAFITGFNSVVGGGPGAVARWAAKTGSKIPISPLRSSIWKAAGKRLGKTVPYLKYFFGGIAYASALESARAAHDSEAAAQIEALAEIVNPLPFSQQDIRDGQAFGKEWFTRKAKTVEVQRFGDLLD